MQVRSSVPRQGERRSPSRGDQGGAAREGEGQHRLLTPRSVPGVAGDAPLGAGEGAEQSVGGRPPAPACAEGAQHT